MIHMLKSVVIILNLQNLFYDFKYTFLVENSLLSFFLAPYFYCLMPSMCGQAPGYRRYINNSLWVLRSLTIKMIGWCTQPQLFIYKILIFCFTTKKFYRFLYFGIRLAGVVRHASGQQLGDMCKNSHCLLYCIHHFVHGVVVVTRTKTPKHAGQQVATQTLGHLTTHSFSCGFPTIFYPYF